MKLTNKSPAEDFTKLDLANRDISSKNIYINSQSASSADAVDANNVNRKLNYFQKTLSLFSYIFSLEKNSLAVSTSLRVLLVGALVGLILSFIVYHMAKKQETDRLMENVSNLVSTVEETVRISCFTADKTLAMKVAKGLLQNSSVAGVSIQSTSEVLAEVDKHLNKYGNPVRSTPVIRNISSPFDSSEVVGTIALFTDDEEIRLQANRYSLLLVFITIVEILLVSFAVGWLVLQRIVYPIRDFSDQLEKIEINSGKLISIQTGNELNEIGVLSNSFNKLLFRLFGLLQSEKEWGTKLLNKEKLFRTLAENSPNLIVRYNLDCQIIFCNPAYDFENGIPSGAALGKKPEDMWFASNITPAAYSQILHSVAETEQEAQVLLEWQSKDGKQICIEFHLVPERDAWGQITSVLAIGHDISSLKLQQKQSTERSLVLERIIHGGDLFEVLGLISTYVENSLGEFYCAILLSDSTNNTLRIGAGAKLPPSYIEALNRWDLDFHLEGDVNSYWADFKSKAFCYGLNVLCNEIILDSENNILGILALYQNHPNAHHEFDTNIVQQASSLSSIVIERYRIEEKVKHQASYDALTALPNRRLFGNKLHDEISKARRHNGNVTLMFIDLDHFKAVNDTLGHEIGDLLLQEAAVRISSCVRETDTVARLGGDEFVIVIPDVSDILQLRRVAKDIVDAVSQPFVLRGKSAYVSASIGIANYPSDADCKDKLLKCADQAMYVAKESGRSGFQFYSSELSFRANERQILELDLRDGLSRGELEVYYQPKVSLQDNSLVGSEALLRWNHPQRGLLSPDEFIFIAEEIGLIVDIGQSVLRDACWVAVEWNGFGKPIHKIAVNMSARQFVSKNLVNTVLSILKETQCNPEWIELEIKESLLLKNENDVLLTLNKFHEMGITIAIDDFGTGYSSLSYLAHFPIDILKIDQSFTSHVNEGGHHRELVKAIISIARSLKQKVVAEGVETLEQAAIMQAYGCHFAQGYLYSEPVTKLVFETLPRSFGAAPSSPETIASLA